MIDELRIKCPSCGLLLDVRNSKHEAVKTITCPGCKKRLSVDFQEKQDLKSIPPFYYGEMPIALHEGLNQVSIPDCAHIEINVIRISDGNYKCIVRPLSAEHPVFLNGTQMEQEDKAVLSKGDNLRIGNTTLTYGKVRESVVAPQNYGILLGADDTKLQKKHRSYGWLIGIASLAVTVCLVILLWPKREMAPLVIENEVPVPIDTPAVAQTVPVSSAEPHPTVHQPEPRQTERTVRETESSQPVEPSYSSMNDYELELLARNDVKAQYEYGKRLVNKADSTRIVLGINYLKMAIRNGSNDAQQALQNLYNSLEQKAANGNSIAESILREQR